MIYEKRKNNQRTVSGTVSNDRCDLCGPDHRICPDPAAIPGLFVGCLIGNILGGAILPDIIVGSMATLLGAIFTYLLRNRSKWLAPLPPIIANTVLIPFVLYYGYQILLPIPFQMLTVGIGEVLSCGILGMIVYTALNKYKTVIFRQ